MVNRNDASLTQRTEMRLSSIKKQQLPGFKFQSLAEGCELDLSLKALHDDLAGRLMLRDLLTRRHDDPDHLESGGLEERPRFGLCQSRFQGPDIDDFSRSRM